MKKTDNGVNKEKMTYPAPEEKKAKEVRDHLEKEIELKKTGLAQVERGTGCRQRPS